MNNKLLKTFGAVALLEGISYLVLFANMLLIKPNKPELYKTLLYPIGMAHGVLFIGYVLLLFLCWGKFKWSFTRLVLFFLASLLPFATFWVDNIVKKESKANA